MNVAPDSIVQHESADNPQVLPLDMMFNTTDQPPPQEANDLALHIFGAIVITVVTLFTIFGNVFNLLVLTRTRSLHSNPGFFMMSLAVADLGAGLVNLFTTLPSSYMNYWLFPQAVCDMAGFLAAWFYTVSIYTLTAVSIDRYLAISNPLRYHDQFPRRYCIFCIFLIWVVSTFIFLTPFAGYGSYEFKWTAYICMCDFTKHFWITMAADFLVVIPCTITTAYCYIRIYFISRRHMVDIQKQIATPEVKKRSAKLKAIRTVAITVLAFYLSWLPYTVQQTTLLFVKGIVTPPVFDFILNWIAIGNSFMNCIIYSTTNRVFRESGRQTLLKIFCCAKKVDPNSNGSGSKAVNNGESTF